MGFAKAFKLGPRTHARYWGCSTFSKWITKTFADPQYVKPYAATCDEWRAWRELYSVNHPKTYWVTEEALDTLQDIVYYPYDLYRSIRYYIKNRWVNETHLVRLPSVEPGSWSEYDNRILEANFQLLVDFVEKDSSVEELMWATKLVYDDDWGVEEDDIRFGMPTDQAISATKILALYNWWKGRPNWPDPWSDWNAITALEPRKSLWSKPSESSKEAMDAATREEERRYQEETQKLVELVSIRRSLWT